MSGGPAKRRRIAGERTGATAGSPSALPTRAPTAPRRPARPVRGAGGGTGSRDTSGRSARSATDGGRRTRAARDRSSTTTSAHRPRGPRLRALLRPPARERGWFLPLALLAVGCLVAGLALAGYGGWQVVSERREVDARDAAASAAGVAIETIYTYDVESLSADMREAETTMTPAFQRKYAKIPDVIKELSDQRPISVRSTARDTAAMPCGDECSATTQRVMVFFDQSVSAGEGTVPQVVPLQVALTMQQRGGRWLVDRITVL